MNEPDLRPETSRPNQRRSRTLLVIFLIVAVGLSILAAVLIQRGLGDDDLQRELQELRDEGL